MTTYTMRPLTETSWILLENEERIGLVSQKNNKLLVIGSLNKKTFDNINELKLTLGNLTIEEPVNDEIEKAAGDINGFPIKHNTCFNVEIEPVASYTKTDVSTVRYAAGYYILKFPNGWTSSFCPKMSTLAEYEFAGPYKTKLEMQNSISQKNRISNV